MQSQAAPVRASCSSALLQFLLDYPLGECLLPLCPLGRSRGVTCPLDTMKAKRAAPAPGWVQTPGFVGLVAPCSRPALKRRSRRDRVHTLSTVWVEQLRRMHEPAVLQTTCCRRACTPHKPCIPSPPALPTSAPPDLPSSSAAAPHNPRTQARSGCRSTCSSC